MKFSLFLIIGEIIKIINLIPYIALTSDNRHCESVLIHYVVSHPDYFLLF